MCQQDLFRDIVNIKSILTNIVNIMIYQQDPLHNIVNITKYSNRYCELMCQQDPFHDIINIKKCLIKYCEYYNVPAGSLALYSEYNKIV